MEKQEQELHKYEVPSLKNFKGRMEMGPLKLEGTLMVFPVIGIMISGLWFALSMSGGEITGIESVLFQMAKCLTPFVLITAVIIIFFNDKPPHYIQDIVTTVINSGGKDRMMKQPVIPNWLKGK